MPEIAAARGLKLAVAAAAALLASMSASALGDAAFDATEKALRSELFADPGAVLVRLKDAKRLASEQQAASVREVRLAALERIEGEAYRRLDRPEDAQPLLASALRRAARYAPRSALYGDLLLSTSALQIDQAQVGPALQSGQRAYRVFSGLKQDRGRIKALIFLSFVYDNAKDFASAVKYLKQAQSIGLSDPDLAISVYNNLAGALKELGRYEEADRVYRAAYAIARRRDAALVQATILAGRARTALSRGDEALAATFVRQGLELSRRDEAASMRAPLTVLRAQLLVRQGRPAAALRLLGPLLRDAGTDTTSLRTREVHETAWAAFRAAGRPAEALLHLEALKRLDDEATKLATSNSAALMAARFDFANQELRIATLRAEELRRNVEREREQARTERLIFAGAAAASLLVLVLLGVGLIVIRRSRNAAREANRGLERSNAELNRALAARTEFLATTSHEIRTPLNGILGMTQVMLADPGFAGPRRERVEVVHAAGNTMRALVDDILDVAKIESGRLTLEQVPFDLGGVLAEAARLWEQPLAAKGVAFRHRADLGPAEVVGDPARVRQVLFNLLSNAAKFTEAGTVSMTAERAGDRVRIVVADTGVGIPADKLEQIFESFRQADAGTARRFGGTGLGLSICRQLARAMGGDVEVESRPDEGSRFTLVLPLPAAPDRAAAPAEAGPLPWIVADANPIARAVLRAVLDRAGLPVAAAASLAEAVGLGHAAGLVADASVLGADAADSLARLTGMGVPVLLLHPANSVPPAPPGVTLVAKPVTGPELLRRIADARDGGNPPLVSRAA